MGMTVTVQEEWNKETESYKIVGTTEADILADVPRVSNESLFGKQLLWKKKWDSLSLKNGAGESISYKILEVA
jgi:transcription elongation factor GreA